MPKYRVWTHFDTGYSQVVEAKDEDEACEIAKRRLECDELPDFDEQYHSNLQYGETYVSETLGEGEDD